MEWRYVGMKVSHIKYPVHRHDGAAFCLWAREISVRNTIRSLPQTHLGDAQPDVSVPLRVVEAKLDFLRFVGVEVEDLV